MRRALLVGAAAAALVPVASAWGSDPITTPAPLSQEGCVSAPGDTCTYNATRTGGYVADGSGWSLVVAFPAAVGDPRDVNLDGKLTYRFSDTNAPPQGCGLFDPGATVTTTGGAQSGLAAGSPFPAPLDPVLGTSNDCEGGTLPNRADATPE